MSDPLANFQLLTEFIEQRVPRLCGKPYTKRGRQDLAKTLPIVRIGAVPYVDLVKLANQLHNQSPAPRTRRVRLGSD